MVKNLSANAVDVGKVGSVPGSGRFPGSGNGNAHQYCSLENSMDRGRWGATVQRITKSDTTGYLSTHACKQRENKMVIFCRWHRF